MGQRTMPHGRVTIKSPFCRATAAVGWQLLQELHQARAGGALLPRQLGVPEAVCSGKQMEPVEPKEKEKKQLACSFLRSYQSQGQRNRFDGLTFQRLKKDIDIKTIRPRAEPSQTRLNIRALARVTRSPMRG